MKNWKQHSQEDYLSRGEHHVHLAKRHQALAELHKGLSDYHAGKEEAEPARAHDAIGDEHRELSKAHTQEAARCAECAKAVESYPDTMPAVSRETHTNADEAIRAALGVDDLSKIRPDGARVVLPTDNLQLIPRTGQPTPMPDISRLDPALQELVKID